MIPVWKRHVGGSEKNRTSRARPKLTTSSIRSVTLLLKAQPKQQVIFFTYWSRWSNTMVSSQRKSNALLEGWWKKLRICSSTRTRTARLLF
ncbi:hypothetical protein FOMG_18479 [Fusarium oxysporum f. sp. melonis 26406]|uniref:Uncharacterized protein n=1 Tax=Fusarium oxysporum f. sp. melonis 26406 TaxID=1089452 RepID=W9Z0A0_FUSOX|nr:hypothetical protein FOMG_18479 [Fusarium oxysporum f. sp. melonis 26406]